MLFVCNVLFKRRAAGGKVCHFCFICDVGEKGKFTVSPVKGGAAEKAGVKKGDRLIWIDGAMASELTHSAISKMVSMDLL